MTVVVDDRAVPRSDAGRLIPCEDGAAILEFALALPILLILFAGTFEFGRVLLIRQTMIDAVADGTRYLSRVPDPSCVNRCSPGATEAAARARDRIVGGTRLPADAVRVTSEWKAGDATVALTAAVSLDIEWLRLFGSARSFKLEVAHREPWIAD